jgi:PhnB protein
MIPAGLGSFRDMVDNPPKGFPWVTPYLLYEDLETAMDWLVANCGFEDRVRVPGPDGRLFHGELAMHEGVVMMGTPNSGYRNPKKLGGATQLMYVYVDDVETHHAKAAAGGAKILSEPADQIYGDRNYTLEDPEGHQWTFGQHVRDVAPEDMVP